MNIERLQTLEQALRNLDEAKKRFVMPEGKSSEKFRWKFGTWGQLEPDCGTVACAAGIAGMLPEFRGQGLFTVPTQYSSDLLTVGFDGHLDPIQSMASFLDISCEESDRIFTGCPGNGTFGMNRVTPEMVADRIANLIAGRDIFAGERKAVTDALFTKG